MHRIPEICLSDYPVKLEVEFVMIGMQGDVIFLEIDVNSNIVVVLAVIGTIVIENVRYLF